MFIISIILLILLVCVSGAFYYYYKCTSSQNIVTKKINKLPPPVKTKTRNFSDDFSFDLDDFSLASNNQSIADFDDNEDDEFTLMSS